MKHVLSFGEAILLVVNFKKREYREAIVGINGFLGEKISTAACFPNVLWFLQLGLALFHYPLLTDRFYRLPTTNYRLPTIGYFLPTNFQLVIKSLFFSGKFR